MQDSCQWKENQIATPRPVTPPIQVSTNLTGAHSTKKKKKKKKKKERDCSVRKVKEMKVVETPIEDAPADRNICPSHRKYIRMHANSTSL